jgi:hypothetical protein
MCDGRTPKQAFQYIHRKKKGGTFEERRGNFNEVKMI